MHNAECAQRRGIAHTMQSDTVRRPYCRGLYTGTQYAAFWHAPLYFIYGEIKLSKEYKTLRTCVAAYRNKRKPLLRQGVHKADSRYAQYTSSVPRRSGRVPYHERDSDQRIGQMLRPDAEAFAPEFHFPLYQLHFFAPHPVHSTQRFHLLSIFLALEAIRDGVSVISLRAVKAASTDGCCVVCYRTDPSDFQSSG